MKTLIYTIIILISHAQIKPIEKNNHNIYSIQDTMKLKISIGENIAEAVLYDNVASQDFLLLLPLSLTLEDYVKTEKVAQLSKKLSTKGLPPGFDPSVGDLTYYAPWGNIALFYKDFHYAHGLVSLGRITKGLEYFMVEEPIEVIIQLV